MTSGVSGAQISFQNTLISCLQRVSHSYMLWLGTGRTTPDTWRPNLSAVKAHIALIWTINICCIAKDRTCMCKPAMPLHYTCSSKGDPHKQHSELQILRFWLSYKNSYTWAWSWKSPIPSPILANRDYHKYTLHQLDDISLKHAGSRFHWKNHNH